MYDKDIILGDAMMKSNYSAPQTNNVTYVQNGEFKNFL